MRLANHESEVGELLYDLIRTYNLSKFSYICIPKDIAVNSSSKPYAIDSYPEEWRKIYTCNKYASTDPVLSNIQSYRSPQIWGEYLKNELLSDQQLEILEEAKIYGIYNGITTTINSSTNEINNLTFLFSEDHIPDKNHLEKMRDAMPILTALIGIKLREFKTYNLCQKQLTDREIECLIWTSRGKTVPEISIILGATENTIKSHLKKILMKLNVATKTEAVAKAILFNVVLPTDIL